MALPGQETYNAAFGGGAWQAPAQAGGSFLNALQRAQELKRKQQMEDEEFGLDTRLKKAQLGALERKTAPPVPGQAPQLDPETAFKYENMLRDEYAAKSKDFAAQVGALGRIEKSAKTASPAGDVALIFNYMKMLDPGSTVREGEFATAEQAAGIDDRVRNLYNRAVSGQRLNPDQRKDFYQSARRVFRGALDTQGQVRSGYKSLASRYGVKPENVLLDPADPKWFEEGGFDPEDLTGLGIPPVAPPAGAGAPPVGNASASKVRSIKQIR